jgi:tetratricopeptide (TPR) repeat protein
MSSPSRHRSATAESAPPPTYSFVFRGRGNVYNDMGKYDLAVLDYDEAIRLAPEDGGMFIDRGKIFRSQSKLQQAISDFSNALDLDKKWTAAYRERGLTYKLMGQQQQAIADLTTYDRLEPGDQEVALALSELENSQSSSQPGNPPSGSAPPKELPPEGPTAVPMIPEGGTFVVPVRINDQITLKFVIDSGAADVSVPADVVMTLLRTGTIVIVTQLEPTRHTGREEPKHQCTPCRTGSSASKVKGRSLRSSIRIPSEGLDCFMLPNIAASPLNRHIALNMAPRLKFG